MEEKPSHIKGDVPLEKELAFLERKIKHGEGLYSNLVPAGPEIAMCIRYLRSEIQKLKTQLQT